MGDMLYLLLLAIVQGLTEFLPVSSSGHLVLIHSLWGDADKAWEENLMLDVAVHVGTLFAVLIYFHRTILEMLTFKNMPLIYKLVIGSIPVVIAGFILHQIKPDFLRSLEIMAWMTIFFGILLWLSELGKRDEKPMEEMSFKDAFLIGLAQCFALIPGTSRSGVTMTAGRFLGYARTEAAKFSLLLSIVALSGAGVLLGKDIIETGNAELTGSALMAAGLSFIAALASIAVMMKLFEKFTFAGFAIYRVILGIILLYFIYSGAV
jgi:undecaprenyl-diphosphatase